MKLSLPATVKAKLRRRRLAQVNILPINATIEKDPGFSFFGDRSGVWPVCHVLPPSDGRVYSFGIGNNISFELELLASRSPTQPIEIYAFDPTPQTVDFIEQQTLPPSLYFSPVGLADKCGNIAFFVPRREGRFNYSVVKRGVKYPGKTVSCPVKDFATLCEERNHHSVDVLKLDVEGSEYSALPGILKSSIDIGQVLVEFHYNYPGFTLADTSLLVEQLRDHDFELFWCSERGYEFGFVNRRLLT